jgi:hypothetical protein
MPSAGADGLCELVPTGIMIELVLLTSRGARGFVVPIPTFPVATTSTACNFASSNTTVPVEEDIYYLMRLFLE